MKNLKSPVYGLFAFAFMCKARRPGNRSALFMGAARYCGFFSALYRRQGLATFGYLLGMWEFGFTVGKVLRIWLRLQDSTAGKVW
ncbi:MAG: hypothetical protein FWE19_07380 [Oscillospiraceae bacterium]|nr:hypothetical protein [Oscillospiraceae bacterium]